MYLLIIIAACANKQLICIYLCLKVHNSDVSYKGDWMVKTFIDDASSKTRAHI